MIYTLLIYYIAMNGKPNTISMAMFNGYGTNYRMNGFRHYQYSVNTLPIHALNMPHIPDESSIVKLKCDSICLNPIYNSWYALLEFSTDWSLPGPYRRPALRNSYKITSFLEWLKRHGVATWHGSTWDRNP